MKKNQHVVLHGRGEWAVKGEGNRKAITVTKTQNEAISVAIRICKNQKSEVIIHGTNGRIRDKDSYGNDPFPPRDKKH